MLPTTCLLLFVSLVCCVVAIPSPKFHDFHDHDHENEVHDRRLPAAWYQAPDHPVHSLFRRAPSGDGSDYAPVGSPAWSAGFPPMGAIPSASLTPPEWTAALNDAVTAGRIPDIPRAPYPAGVNPSGPQVCAAGNGCRIPGDIYDGPDGIYASSFDDGPYPTTTQLVDFLTSHNLTTTHFMIGTSIILNPTQFLQTFNASHDIAVHTWSHPHMVTLSNADILAELGWTMQLIVNSTGGRVPRYWRPPYGEVDMRVRSIAKEVFGLETVVWNTEQVSADWTASSPQEVTSALTRILSHPKSPGLVTLQHEISASSVNGFIEAFPAIASNGWTFGSFAQVIGDQQSYQNAKSSNSEVKKKGVLLNQVVSSTASSESLSFSSTASTSTPSASQTSAQTSAQTATHEFLRLHLLLFSIILSTLTLLSV